MSQKVRIVTDTLGECHKIGRKCCEISSLCKLPTLLYHMQLLCCLLPNAEAYCELATLHIT